MIAQLSKRFLSLLLAMVMIISMIPVQAFATENGHVHGDVANHHSCGWINDQEHACLWFFDSRGGFR